MVLCDDEHIRALNLEWRQKDAATDVLSFPMGDDVPPGYPARMLGDVVISLDTATQQAADAGYAQHQNTESMYINQKYIVCWLLWTCACGGAALALPCNVTRQ